MLLEVVDAVVPSDTTKPVTFTLRVKVNGAEIATEPISVGQPVTFPGLRTAIRAKLFANKLIMLHRAAEALGQNLETG